MDQRGWLIRTYETPEQAVKRGLSEPYVVLCAGPGAQLAAVLQDQGTTPLSQRMACGSKHP